METADLPSPYTESALVTAIHQEMEDTAPPSVSCPSSTLSSMSSSEEDYLSIADRVTSRRRRCVPQPVDDPDPATSHISVSPSVGSSASSSCVEQEINNNNRGHNNTTGANCITISNLLSCMKLVAPNDKFDTRKSNKMKKKRQKR